MIPTGLFTAVIPPLDGEYLYRFDPNTGSLLSGFRLELPFGRRSTTGFVLSVDTEKEKIAYSAMKEKGVTVKQINVEGATLAYQSEQFSLMDWMARYYGEPLSKILDLAVPNSAHEKKDLYYLLNEGQELGNLGKAQQKLVDFLRLNNSQAYASEIRAALGNCSATLTSLLKRQILTVSDDAIQRLLEDHENFANHPEDVLNEAQLTAGTTISSAVAKHEFLSFLLHGVTGSGKTEVYMHAIRTALESNRGSLVIVPEIALTPQLVERFERKVGAAISVLHSSLKPRERWANWVKLLNGDVKIALGARSAIFAPVKDLGLIVVDEEHDGSFKQGEGIRYNARDLALVRGKMSSCPVVLGSATPSLETFYNTVNNRHINLSLPGRFHNSKKLKYSLIDLNKLKPWEMPSKSISPELVALIQDTLDKQEQAFILYNRRGFASYMQCTHCEHVIKCPHCSVTLTYHQRPVSLLCHFCGYSSAPLIVCPSCHKAEPKESKHGIQSSSPFALRGGGTERVFEDHPRLWLVVTSDRNNRAADRDLSCPALCRPA